MLVQIIISLFQQHDLKLIEQRMTGRTYSHCQLLKISVVQEGFDVVHREAHQQVQGYDGQQEEEDDKHCRRWLYFKH